MLYKGSSPLNQSLHLRDGVWFKKGKVYLNPASLFIPKILAYGHSFLVLDITKLSLILSRVSSGLECMGWSMSI